MKVKVDLIHMRIVFGSQLDIRTLITTCPQRKSIPHNYLRLDLLESIGKPVHYFTILNNVVHIFINYFFFKDLAEKLLHRFQK